MFSQYHISTNSIAHPPLYQTAHNPQFLLSRWRRVDDRSLLPAPPPPPPSCWCTLSATKEIFLSCTQSLFFIQIRVYEYAANMPSVSLYQKEWLIVMFDSGDLYFTEDQSGNFFTRETELFTKVVADYVRKYSFLSSVPVVWIASLRWFDPACSPSLERKPFLVDLVDWFGWSTFSTSPWLGGNSGKWGVAFSVDSLQGFFGFLKPFYSCYRSVKMSFPNSWRSVSWKHAKAGNYNQLR